MYTYMIYVIVFIYSVFSGVGSNDVTYAQIKLMPEKRSIPGR